MLLAESLEFHAHVRPTETAVLDERRSWSFQELRNDAIALANAIREEAPRGRVGICAANHGLHVALLYAIAASGIEGVVLDPKWSSAELESAVGSFGISTVFADADLVPRLEGVTAVTAITLDDGTVERHSPSGGTGAARNAISVLSTIGSPANTYLVSPSGGTSGRIKGVQISHSATISRFVTQLVEFGIPRGGRYLAATPLFHGSARSLGLGYLYSGATLQLLDTFDPDRFLELAVDATASFCVPTMLQRLLKVVRAPLPTTFRLISGGSILDESLGREVRARLTPNFSDYYASVESGPIAIRHAGDDHLPAGCVGRPAFGVHVSIVDPDEAGFGLIEVGGPSVANGYEGDVDQRMAERAKAHRLIRPGDLGRLDELGYLHLLGRADDMIITGGVNVAPAEVERALEALPGVARAIVVGVPDAEWGQRVEAVIVGAGQAVVDVPAIIGALRERLASTKIPKKFHLADSLPMTEMGKVSRKRILGQIMDGTLH